MSLAFVPITKSPIGFAPTSPRARWTLFTRVRYQLIGATVLGVLLPKLARGALFGDWEQASDFNTIIGTFAAMTCGFFVLRRLSGYPGVRSLAFLLPTFSSAYIITVMIFFFFRVDYSRYQFIASFALVTIWFFFVAIVQRRVRRPRLLLLPFGAAGRLAENNQVEWVAAQSSIELPRPLPENSISSAGSQDHSSTPELLSSLPWDISGVVADLRAQMPSQWEAFLAQCALRGVPVYHSKQMSESLTGRVEIEHLSENTLGSLVPNSVYFRFKRTADIVGTIVVGPVALIIGLATAVAIKLDDSGPIFFRQPRTGYRGATFNILKFRTMRSGEQGEKLFTQEGDPRITRVGRFLRRYRIDELPQIVNILRGEMSWIGPRPESLKLSQWYESKIPFYSYRHIVRPGITGWAQVNQGNVAEIAAATSKLHYDFFYIKHFSFWLDLLIAAKTVRTVLTGFGAL